MKSARVKTIKNNVAVGTVTPLFTQDHQAGHWVDSVMKSKGHVVDTVGVVDLPEYGIDNKSRKYGSKASWTIGSMTIEDIIDTPKWEDTRFYKKCKNQNHVEYHPDLREVVKVTVVDFDINLIQNKLRQDYEYLRSCVIEGDRSKEIRGNWTVFDGYSHENSYRMRITNSTMKMFKNISATRDTVNNVLEFE
jgi:hypothetical protein